MSETANANAAYRRHDITDRAWETIAPHLPGGPGKVGRPAEDNRHFSNGVFWILILRTGAPWRDLPPDYGHWNTTYRRLPAGRRTDTGRVCSPKCLMTPTWSG